MRILGIDPGLNITGFGLIEIKNDRLVLIDAGTIEPKSSEGMGLRLNKIHRILTRVIETHQPKVMVLEKIYTHHSRLATASILGHARGVICLAAAQQQMDLVEWPVKRIRKALLGQGNASKEQTQVMVKRMLAIESIEMPLDTSDALALALGHAYMLKYGLTQNV